MPVFDVSEVFQFAIRIEENGEKLYRYAVKNTEEKDVKDTFNHLAEEETKHKRTFEGLLSETKEYEPAETYPGEYSAYLRAYADNIVFIVSTDEELDRRLSRIDDALSALDFAIKRELESIVYYQEMKKFIPQHQHPSVEKVIDEERQHFLKLSEMKRNLKRD